MSRIGKVPIPIPESVTVNESDGCVQVEGPKGQMKKYFRAPVAFSIEDGSVVVAPKNGSRFARAMHGTARSIVAGMIQGVTEGYSKQLEIVGVGFRAVLAGNVLDMNLGYSHPIKYAIPDGISVTVEASTKLTVEGVDKQLVGEVAARIKRYYPVEPYKGKGIRIVGEYVRRKEGKKAG